jgi:hypothetical protein
LCALAACGAPDDDLEPWSAEETWASEDEIVGGNDTGTGASFKWPSVGYTLWRANNWSPDNLDSFSRCTASLIASNAVLTAAHCVVHTDEQCTSITVRDTPAQWTVGFGTYPAPASLTFGVKAVLLNPDFIHERACPGGTDANANHDMAILILDRNVPSEPMRIATPDQYASTVTLGKDFYAVGYGRTSAPGTKTYATAERRYATVRSDGYLSPYRVRTIPITGAPYKGDSGGPLLPHTFDAKTIYGVYSRYKTVTVDATTTVTEAIYAGFGLWDDYNWVQNVLVTNPPKPGSGPSVASWGGTRLDIVQIGKGGELLHRFYDGTRWQPWQSLGGSGLIYDPSIVTMGPNHLDVFAINSAHELVHKWWNGQTWSAWESLGGYLTSSPAAVSWGANHIDVFARDANSAIQHRWFNGAGWQGWESLGGVASSGPAACSWAPGRIDVFVGGYGNQIWQKFYNGSWAADWYPQGGSLGSDPTCMSLGVDNLNIFYRGTDGQLWQKYWNNGWSPHFSLGGSIGSSPEAVRWNGSSVWVIADDVNITMPFAKGWSPNTGWGAWSLF